MVNSGTAAVLRSVIGENQPQMREGRFRLLSDGVPAVMAKDKATVGTAQKRQVSDAAAGMQATVDFRRTGIGAGVGGYRRALAVLACVRGTGRQQ